jgi:hypothetical protein
MVQKHGQKQKNRTASTEIRLFKKIEGKTREDRIRNSTFRENLKIKPALPTVKVVLTFKTSPTGWTLSSHRDYLFLVT